MIVYTAEDFAQAMFAMHPDPDAVDARYAARMSRDPERPWLLDGVPGNGDEHMARDGWVPVVESRITDHTLRRVEERAERNRQKLIAHIESVEAAVRDRNRTIEELYAARQEASRRESAAHDRVVTLLGTKETLERTIYELRHDLAVARKVPEPWADLADALRAHTGEPDPDETARMLYENGVRMAGGEES